MKQPNDAIIVAGDMTGDLVSDPIPMEQECLIAIQMAWTGTPAGNFTVETTCDLGQISIDGTVTGLTNWETYPNSTHAAGGAPGVFTWRPDTSYLPDRWARLKYTHSSSTGVLNARFQAKG